MNTNYKEKLEQLVASMIDEVSDFALDGHIQEALDALDAGHIGKIFIRFQINNFIPGYKVRTSIAELYSKFNGSLLPIEASKNIENDIDKFVLLFYTFAHKCEFLSKW